MEMANITAVASLGKEKERPYTCDQGRAGPTALGSFWSIAVWRQTWAAPAAGRQSPSEVPGVCDHGRTATGRITTAQACCMASATATGLTLTSSRQGWHPGRPRRPYGRRTGLHLSDSETSHASKSTTRPPSPARPTYHVLQSSSPTRSVVHTGGGEEQYGRL